MTPKPGARSRRFKISLNSLSVPLVLLLLFCASTLRADRLLRIERTTENVQNGTVVHTATEQGFLYLGDEHARFDHGDDVTWILRMAEQKLFFVRHDTRTYQEFEVPLRLEELVSEEERRLLERMEPNAVPRLVVETPGESRIIDGQKARKVIFRGRPVAGETVFAYELWMVDLEIDLELYRTMLRESGAVDFIFRTVADHLANLEGFPLERTTRISSPDGTHLDRRRLIAIEEKEVPPDFYTPPAGYTRTEFVLSDWLRPPSD